MVHITLEFFVLDKLFEMTLTFSAQQRKVATPNNLIKQDFYYNNKLYLHQNQTYQYQVKL